MKKNKNKSINQLEAEILQNKITDKKEHGTFYNIIKGFFIAIYIAVCGICTIIEWLFYIFFGIVIIFILKHGKKG